MGATTATLEMRQAAYNPPWWQRLNLWTALLGGLVGFVFVNWVLGRDGGPLNLVFGWEINQTLVVSYFAGLFGFMLGLGALNYPIMWILGYTPSQEEQAYQYGIGQGWDKYLRMTLDHKVVGLQYLVGIIAFFCVAGFNAMMIRTELLTPNATFVDPGVYLTIVGEHSVMMLMITSGMILGPFGNYFIPLMIGAKRMAYPRLEALSFWIFLPAMFILLSGFIFGGFPTAWTGYAPLADEGRAGMDAYCIAWITVTVSVVLASINILATIVMLRAPGMTWTRMPLTVWSVSVGAILIWLSFPIMACVQSMTLFDRTLLTGFYVPVQGGSAYLYENLFWTFGHPEVYILMIPGMGVMLDIVAVFARRTVYAYRAAVVGMFGIGLLSWFVWQHHLFVSGLTPGLRPFFMFSTEMISFPTGFIFLSALGTLFGSRLRFTVPFMFALAWLPNFLLGGFSGIFLSDTPVDVQLHGSYFVQAHFHFVLMGGTLFALFAAIYYWFPKISGGRMFNSTLGYIHFWMMEIGFNGTFITLAIVGMMGMPRRVTFYASYMTEVNQIATWFAYLLGASMIPFLINFIYSWQWGKKAEENPWDARSLEWMTPTPVPIDDFEEIPLV